MPLGRIMFKLKSITFKLLKAVSGMRFARPRKSPRFMKSLSDNKTQEFIPEGSIGIRLQICLTAYAD
jgi:hypothetical protein